MPIDAKTVMKIREMTGAGMMDAKRALTDANGDVDAAIELLRKAGLAKATKRAGRLTREGLVYNYIHGTGKLGVMVELQCETDFVARNEDFRALAHQIAMHIAASDPKYLDADGISAEAMTKARAEFEEVARGEGKPDAVIAKIVDGKVEKYISETVLMKQPFVMDEEKTIETVISDAIAKIGENIKLNRFARFNIDGAMTACEATAKEE